MKTTNEQTSRRHQAMTILENLARRLNSMTADFFYLALEEEGFSEDERVKLVGACFRTAQKNRWLQRTSFSQKSTRNNSNLLSVWHSNLYGVDKSGGQIPRAEVEAEYSRWRGKGMEPPDRLAKFWLWQKEFMDQSDRGEGAKTPADSLARQASRLQGIL